MVNLRTLEDILPETCCQGVDKKELKKEAKQHIKYLKKMSKKNANRKYITNPLIKWIEYFFELNETVYAFDKNDYLVQMEDN